MNSGHRSRCVRAWLAALAVFALPSPARADSSAADSAWAKAFTGAQLLDEFVREREEYWVPLGKLYGNGQAEKFATIEGRWSHFAYANPPGRTVIEIFDSYEETLRKQGFEIVYSCKDGDCGQGGRSTNGDWWDPTERRRYLVAELERAAGNVWVCVHVHEKPPKVAGQHDVDVIEAPPAASAASPDDTPPRSADLYAQLERAGHAAVYGIAWDARGEPVSEYLAGLRTVADLLTAHPKLQLYLVVHTDNVGGVQANVDRSRKQATALANLLVRRYGIAAARIRPSGMGPLAPVAANDTEDGRAKNRRVDLVRP